MRRRQCRTIVQIHPDDQYRWWSSERPDPAALGGKQLLDLAADSDIQLWAQGVAAIVDAEFMSTDEGGVIHPNTYNQLEDHTQDIIVSGG